VIAAAVAAAPAPLAAAKAPNNIATGFVVGDGSWLVTAAHVVASKPCIAIADGAIENGRDAPAPLHWEAAQLLAVNPRLDVAVLRIAAKRPPLVLADWLSVPIGLEALVVGYPQPSFLGRSIKITRGLYAGIPEIGRPFSLFQLSATIELGNSGGPVLSPDGLVIGLVRARAEPGAFGKAIENTPQIVNFALNSMAIRDFLVGAGISLGQAPVNAEATTRPFETLRRAQRSVLLIAAGDWRGEANPMIAGQRLGDSLPGSCVAG